MSTKRNSEIPDWFFKFERYVILLGLCGPLLLSLLTETKILSDGLLFILSLGFSSILVFYWRFSALRLRFLILLALALAIPWLTKITDYF